MCACAGEIVTFLRGRKEEERRRKGVKEGSQRKAQSCSGFAVRRTLMNVLASHLCPGQLCSLDRPIHPYVSSTPDRVSKSKTFRNSDFSLGLGFFSLGFTLLTEKKRGKNTFFGGGG